MEDEGIIPVVEYDPFNPKSRMTGTKEQIAPYADEVAAKFRAELDLQAERRAKWPEIEERRRKKLAQIYPVPLRRRQITGHVITMNVETLTTLTGIDRVNAIAAHVEIAAPGPAWPHHARLPASPSNMGSPLG